jgi:hypothetical protein
MGGIRFFVCLLDKTEVEDVYYGGALITSLRTSLGQGHAAVVGVLVLWSCIRFQKPFFLVILYGY